jgi:ARC6-like, IMS domain
MVVTMKKLLIFSLIFLVYGCKSGSGNTSAASTKSNECPEHPQGTLSEKNVESVSLQQGPVSKTGNISPGQQKAYSFEAKKGSKLSYRTKDDICVWIYAPDTTLLNGDELKLDGKYMAQVSSLKGSTSFNLEIGLGNLSEPSSDASKSSSVSTTQSASGDLDQSKAQQLVQGWLDSKYKMFAPPFDRTLAKQLTTGPLYQDITKSDGPMNWLQNNNSYYSYSKLAIDKVWAFSGNTDRPSLKVTISEDRVLHGKNGKPDPSESGASTDNWKYFFMKEDRIWKIYDYKKDN